MIQLKIQTTFKAEMVYFIEKKNNIHTLIDDRILPEQNT